MYIVGLFDSHFWKFRWVPASLWVTKKTHRVTNLIDRNFRWDNFLILIKDYGKDGYHFESNYCWQTKSRQSGDKKPFRLFFVNLSDHLKVQQDGLRSLESRAILWRETIFQSGTSSRFQFDWNLVAEDDGKHLEKMKQKIYRCHKKSGNDVVSILFLWSLLFVF